MNGFRALSRHARSIVFLTVVLAMAGAAAGLRLPVSLFPQVQFPLLVVAAEAGATPIDRMELEVTRPLEEALRVVPGVRGVRSTTTRGSADITVDFAWGTDMVSAVLQAQAAAAQAKLPAEATFSVQRRDPTVFPMLAYSLTSATRDGVGLRNLAEQQLQPLVATVPGVAKVAIVGGAQGEVRIEIDPMRLDAYGLTLQDVTQALSAANLLSAAGRLEDRQNLYLVVLDTRLADLDQIGQVTLGTAGGGTVRLGEVARIHPSEAPQWMRVTADGRDAVLVQIHQQPDGNSVQIARTVAARLSQLGPRLPADVKVSKWYDQSELITASAASVRDAILLGVALAAAMLFLFLRNLRITLIAVLAVPAVLAVAVLVLSLLGMSFNIMTLGGMAAAAGLIIDDVIVMLEQIVRRMGRDGEPVGRGALGAAAGYFGPLTGSSACTVVIFLPLAFLDGVTGAFFRALSLTMAAALAISWAVSLVVAPLLAARLLRAGDAEDAPPSRFARAVHRRYRRTFNWLLRHPAGILIGLVPLVLLGVIAYGRVGTGFMPAMDEGGFILDYRAAPGLALSETDRLVRQIEAVLRDTPEVESYSRRTGSQLGDFLTEANEGDFFVRLKGPPRRDAEAVMDSVRGRVEAQVPGVEVELAQLMEDVIGDLTAVPQPIEVKLFADDAARLREGADAVAATLRSIPGVVDVNNGIHLAGDDLAVDVDRAKTAVEGITVDDLRRQLEALLSGIVGTSMQVGLKSVGLRVWVPSSLRSTVEQVGELRVRAPDGHTFPLRRVAALRIVHGEAQRSRENLRRMVAVTARINGRDLGSAIADVRTALAKPGVVDGVVDWELGGLYRQQQLAFRGLAIVFVSAALLVFLVLLFLFERFRVALVILAAPLTATSAVFIALWATGMVLDISSLMGLTMILGIVTEVAVFYFAELFVHDADGRRPAAFLRAGAVRLRPIAMTTLAAMLALLPLALGLGQGARMQQPLAVAIVAGLAVQMPLVLLAMPVVFFVLQRRRGRHSTN